MKFKRNHRILETIKRVWAQRRKLWVVVLLFLIPLGFRLWPSIPLCERRSSSLAFYDQGNRLLRLTLSGDEKYRLWVPLEEIHPYLQQAVLLYEDRCFFYHPGFNPYALLRAAYGTYIAKSRRLGGSTLTMQLARMLSGISTKTCFGKIKQIMLAFWLELRYSKKEILEAYLNYAPYGDNIEGAGTAGLIYFSKDANQLTLNQAVTLAVIPQNPVERMQHPEQLAEARRILVQKWAANHVLSEEEGIFLQKSPEFYTAKELPFKAPHFVDMLIQGRSYSQRKTLLTTLDLDIQTLLEERVRSYITQNSRFGMQNASVLLLDYNTMEIKALVGSADFFSESISGQINGALAKRSPGSALKPFIYALGIDQGLIHSQTLMKDTPASFGAYAPDNFDGNFSGPLSAQEALIRSRNIPAVYIASKLADPNFYGFLKNAGISGLKAESHYGLSLVLGSAEISLYEISGLYAALANQGRLKPIKVFKSPAQNPGTTVLSREASFIILDMLKNNPRPDYPQHYSWMKNNVPVYWKSGTSYGFRDAWAVGVFGPYVLGVWVGNFDGIGNPAFVGTKAAGPLFFSIIDAVQIQNPGVRDLMIVPPQVKEVEVCAVSGQLKGPYCGQGKPAWFIPGRSPIETCGIHLQVWIDIHSGLRSCVAGDKNNRAEIYEFWPSDILSVFAAAGIPRRVPPPFIPECKKAMAAYHYAPPQIISPREGVTYSIRPSDPYKRTIALEAILDANSRKIFWFIDDRFLGSAERGRSLDWQAEPGRFTLRAVDDSGGADTRVLIVQTEK